MAIVVALSQEFHNRIGEKVTGELAEWLNTMDTNLHNEIRQSSDRNVELFRVEMKSGFAEVEGKIAALEVRFDAKFTAFEARLLRTMMFFWTASLLSMLGVLVALK